MEVLLPSEIARLVLGYLEDQKCNEAAKIFLETSPHLQECRTVISNGRRFSTKVSGMTLIEFFEKFSAINIMIQERMSRIADSEQLKNCGDLVEQLKFLVEETRGQRFVVNINVPSQANSQVSNGSPIISSSMRKRRHSNSDRERCKRTKLLSNSSQQSESACIQTFSSDNVEATPLESLPGHIAMPKELATVSVKEKRGDNVTREHQSSCSSSKYSFVDSNHSTDSTEKIANVGGDKHDRDTHNAMDCRQDDRTKKCTTATSTEELLTFSCAEVQTTPYDTHESESETNDEPIENLSLLTKELLNHTELQERIAENINKAILPTDTSLRDESLNDTVGGEPNTSIMFELNNAIKSIVEATEADPVFEKFLDDIIGPNTETDTSPDEDCDAKLTSKTAEELREKQPEIVITIASSPEPTVPDLRSSNETDLADVPLKHRLRSSSRQQNTRVEDETDKHRDPEKEQSALEDQNAAAVLSIINANIINSNSVNDKKAPDDGKEIICINDNNEKKLPNFVPSINKNEEPVKTILTDNQKADQIVTVQSNEPETKVRKNTVKRPRPAKPKPDLSKISNEHISEQDIMGMPTLIMCSKDEISTLLATSTPTIPNRPICSTFNSRFIPIAPKDPTRVKEKPIETLYVKTVNVAHKVMPLPAITQNDLKNHPKKSLVAQKRNTKVSDKTKDAEGDTSLQIFTDPVISSVTPDNTKLAGGGESITLYSNENTAKTLLDTRNMPTISVEENLSLSDTGLSPYLKFNSNKVNQNHSLSDIDLALIPEIPKVPTQSKINANNDQLPSTSTTADCDLITKRTPRTLLKSRSKNHRLSLSTPRRRSSHIRALDFSTPTKITASNRTMSDSENVRFSPRSSKHTKSVCRTSLFKSPPFSNNAVTSHKIKSPLKLCHPCKLPIATRIPAPKLMGGWEKYNGFGVIVGDVSPCKALATGNPSDNENQACLPKPKKDTWDADLRRALQVEQEKEQQKGKATNKNKGTRKTKNTTISKKGKQCSASTSKSKTKKVPAKDIVDDESQRSQNPVVPTFVEQTENSTGSQILEKEETSSKPPNQPVENNLNDTKKDMVDEEITPITSQKCSANPSTAENKIAKTVALPKEHATNASTVMEKKSVKKYAQLKTLKTNLKNVNTKKEREPESNTAAADTAHTTELRKTPVDLVNQILQIPSIIDLETPRKFENSCGVPPTPRVLSPSSSTTPFIRISEDSGKVRSFISTPEFPPTPCIALTPKQAEETTTDNMKKDNFNSCSSYYRPTSEKNNGLAKLTKLKSDSGFQKCAVTSSNITNQGITSTTNAYQTCASGKLEITQFEVIKENLPKEEAVKELKISSNSRDPLCTMKMKDNCAKVDSIEVRDVDGNSNGYQTAMKNERCVFNSEESSDSDTSTSSGSTSSSSSSSSSSASSNSNTTNLSGEYQSDQKSKRIPNKIYTDTSNESAQKIALVEGTTNNMLNSNVDPTQLEKETVALIKLESTTEIVIGPKCEFSPLKVFPITKSDEELQSTMTETPAKDDTLLNEADISETPSSSKSGVETLTNLSSKISALISSEDGKLSKGSNLLKGEGANVIKPKQSPKIVSAVQLRSNVLIFQKAATSEDPCIAGNEDRPQYAEDKLVVELEEKRKRMISKLRDIPKSNVTRGRIQQNRATLRGKTRYNNLRKNTRYKHPTTNDGCSSYKTYLKESNHDTMAMVNPSTSSSQIKGKETPNAVKMYCKQRVIAASRIAKNKTSKFEEKRSDTKYTDDEEKTQEIGIASIAKNNASDDRVRIIKEETSAAPKISVSTWAVEEKQETTATRNVIDITAANCPTTDITEKDDIPKEGNIAMKQVEKNSTVSDKTVHGDVSDTTKKEHQSQNEQKVCKTVDFTNLSSTTKSILKSKVDQVKRDLFSDEENELRTANPTKSPNNEKNSNTDMQTSDIVNAAMQNRDTEIVEDLPCVLECLQLVPAYKNDQVGEDAVENRKQINLCTSMHPPIKYFITYDDSVPIKKRRRRYSNEELEILFMRDGDCESSVKVYTATDLEEIYNVTPKSKKRLGIKKSPIKSEKNCGTTSKTINSNFTINDIYAKPLATSSPVDKPVAAKMKIAGVKSSTVNEENNEVQSDYKKKQKVEKLQETEKDNQTTKARKTKISETKERKQIEKKQHVADPQILLNTVDLDKFLTTVHGPE